MQGRRAFVFEKNRSHEEAGQHEKYIHPHPSESKKPKTVWHFAKIMGHHNQKRSEASKAVQPNDPFVFFGRSNNIAP